MADAFSTTYQFDTLGQIYSVCSRLSAALPAVAGATHIGSARLHQFRIAHTLHYGAHMQLYKLIRVRCRNDM